MFTAWSTGIDEAEFLLVCQGQNLATKRLSVLSSTGLHVEEGTVLRAALRDDLIILSLSGHNPLRTVRGLVQMAGERQWRQRKAKIVLRTQDSHHQLRDELAIIDDIDLIAIAHSNYLEFFPAGKALHVPCSIYSSRSTATEWLTQTSTAKDVDVVFPFQLYRGEPRNALAYEVLRKLKKEGISARFGFFRYFRNQESPPLLWEELARARVILNLPLRDDFNIRNLEASLFPGWHVTPKLPDHDAINMDWSNTRFVSAESSAIVSVIKDILNSGEVTTLSPTPRDVVLSKHTASDRIYYIIDTVLGTTLQEQPKVFDAVSTPNKKQPIVTLFDEMDLLYSSPTLLTPVATNSLYRPSMGVRLKATFIKLVLYPKQIMKKIARGKNLKSSRTPKSS